MNADAMVAGTDLATKHQPNPASNDLLDEDMSPLKRAPPSRGGRARSPAIAAVAITDGIIQFAGEREMWASFQDANLRKRRRLKAVIGGAVLLVSCCPALIVHCYPDYPAFHSALPPRSLLTVEKEQQRELCTVHQVASVPKDSL